MKSYCAADFSALLQVNNLSCFEDIWQLELDVVDEPNRERGGWSSVCKLQLNNSSAQDFSFYLKRQSNHLSRSWQHPFGEPTFAREYRNIVAYAEQNVAALDAAYFSQRKINGEQQAILITRSLDEYEPLGNILERWQELDESDRFHYLKAIGELVGRLHLARFTHHCLYPKHIYLNLSLSPSARLIDLEKTRYQFLRRRECVADLSALLRRCMVFSATDREVLLAHYLSFNSLGLEVEEFVELFYLRKNDKDTRP